MTPEERAYCIAQMHFLKPVEKFLLWQKITRDGELFTLRKSDLEGLFSRRIRASIVPDKLIRRCMQDFQWMDAYGIKVLTIASSHYPRFLREIYDPPLMLLYRGSFAQNEKCISIVGTRKASEECLRESFALAEAASNCGYTVVSGLAKGIDSAAHRGALAAAGKTIAVLGCGIDRIYPAQHKQLAQKILKNNGVLCSEYPLGTPPLKFHFPARNRIISGMAEALVLIEAPKRSGAMISARLALEQGREVFVHRSGMQSDGVQELAAQGAPVVSSIEDIQKAIIDDWSHLLKFSDVRRPISLQM